MRKLIDLDALSRYHQKLKASYQNDLTATAAGRALDARQGKALKALVDEMGVHMYAHQRSGTAHLLTGSGVVGRAYITAAYQSGDTFFVNGAAVTAYMGEDTVDELPAGRWVTFVYDPQRATINFKQGGAGLNVKVISASALPQSPKENTVWVNTSVPMGAWQFCPAQPTARPDGSALQAGDVWIRLYPTSNAKLNALKLTASKRNGVMLYLSGCWQYVGGAWTSKPVQVYLGGQWLTPQTVSYLYNQGAAPMGIAVDLITNSSGCIVFDTASILITGPWDEAARAYAQCYVDLTAYTTLKVTYAVSSGYCTLQAAVSSISGGVAGEGLIAIASRPEATSGVMALDISSISGACYVKVGSVNSVMTASQTMRIYAIELS